MIVHPCEQGTPEWQLVRIGIPTASRFDVLITAKKLEPADGAGMRTYLCEKLAERLLGKPIETGSSGYMVRGSAMESQAREWYQFTRDVEVTQAGFVALDDGSAGGSPDGYVGDDGIIEIKTYSVTHHIAALLEHETGHAAQCQGLLWLTDRKWVDLVFYSPCLPPIVQRVERDDRYIAKLDVAVQAFTERLEESMTKLVRMGCEITAVAREG